jgi:hypothetical protein
MVWHKAWLDTRWRFLIGFAVLAVMAAGVVVEYRQIAGLLPLLPRADLPAGEGPIGEAIIGAFETQQTYRGFVWYNWFRQSLTFLLVAALLGSGSPFAPPGRGLLFTLALPVPRAAWLRARAALVLAQLFVLVLVPSLVFPLLSPAIGEQYGLGQALAHALCVFTVASVFASLAMLLSTAFADVWQPLLITALVGMCFGFFEISIPSFKGPFSVMAAEAYFQGGALPWTGLAISVLLTAALLYLAAANVARRDF